MHLHSVTAVLSSHVRVMLEVRHLYCVEDLPEGNNSLLQGGWGRGLFLLREEGHIQSLTVN